MSECLSWCFRCNKWVHPKHIPDKPFIFDRFNDNFLPLALVPCGFYQNDICPECEDKEYFEDCKENVALRGPIEVKEIGYRGFVETPAVDRDQVWKILNDREKVIPVRKKDERNKI